RHIADQRIAVLLVAQDAGFWTRLDRAAHNPYIGTMNLPATSQRPVAAEQFKKAPAIFVDLLSLVFVKTGEIERVFGHCTNSTQAGREGVGETSLFQRRAHQRAHTVTLAPVESGAG